MSTDSRADRSETVAGGLTTPVRGSLPSGEAIAVVGMACRFPGAASISAFWHLLESGRNAVIEGVPGSGVGRMDELFPGGQIPSPACRFCGYVDEIEQFDAGFFRISPVEAQLLDPQQRMMLETTWQALEDAGIDPECLRGSRTGVYTGISNDEYRMLVVDSRKPTDAASCLYALSGTNLNGTSGRVSFVLGLMGPSKAVDAACASSMVAIHDAVADLREARADLAIAGGVQAILNSRIFELRADAMMLSPDGQCKTFDASANGYVRGEGCGVVILKRLSEAEKDGDRIWGVIRGSAVNNGGPGTGLTVPHTPALEQVIEAALAQSGVAAADVDYLEAHGTGTAVGDPIEIDAVAAVFGKSRQADNPLLVGSVKTNIGHLESAAGIAGLIKAVLVMQRGVIPKHLHFHNPNPSLDWDRLPLKVTDAMMELPKRNGRPRLAGVNSFGISGTNACIVVEEYVSPGGLANGNGQVVGAARPVSAAPIAAELNPPVSDSGLGRRQSRLLPLSGKSVQAVQTLAQRYLSWLDAHSEDGDSTGNGMDPLLSDMAWTAAVGRSHFDHRMGVVFTDAASLKAELEAVGAAPEAPPSQPAKQVAFAYTGQGSQWVGMGKALYDCEPVARAILDRCEEVFRAERGTSLLDVMFGDVAGNLSDTAWEQPALYALECALTALWSSLGVRPSVVIGHSVGELAAAHAASVFGLEDGMRFAIARGSLLSDTKPGAMAAVFAPPERVLAAVEKLNASSAGIGVSVSADNGAHQVVSGPVAAIEAIAGHFESAGVRVRRLNTSRAFHSALVEPALDRLEAALDGVAIRPAQLTVISNLTGQVVKPDQLLEGAYWRKHARGKVDFARGVESLAGLGVDLVLEIGPRPVLGAMTVTAWPDSEGKPAPRVLSSLNPRSDAAADDGGFTAAVAEAYQTGLAIRFEGLFAGERRQRISVPGYPFQRERYWLDTKRPRLGGIGHPLLGVRHELAGGEVTYETELYSSDPEWLGDHLVYGRIVTPGALFGTMAALASRIEEGHAGVVEDFQLLSALAFPDDDPANSTESEGRTMQMVLGHSERGEPRRIQIYSKGSEADWTLHVEGRIAPPVPFPEAGRRIPIERLKSSLTSVDAAAYYEARAETGIELGPFFRTVTGIWSRPGEALGEISFPDALGTNGLDIHPLLLDGCFQVVAAARNLGAVEEGTTYLPFGWERMWLPERLPDRVFCHVRASEDPPDSATGPGQPREVWTGDLGIYEINGTLIGALIGYMVKRATQASVFSAAEEVDDLLYEVQWRERALVPGLLSASFLASEPAIASRTGLLSAYLAEEGVPRTERSALLDDLEWWSRSRALETLENLGWEREVGAVVDVERLRQSLNVVAEHRQLFRRMLEMLAWAEVLEEVDDGFVVRIGAQDPLPEKMPRDLEAFAARMAGQYAHGRTEIGLFQRCGGALADVLQGQADPLTVLFSSGDPTPGDLYLKAPVARAANRLLRETVETLVDQLPADRQLRVIEVGAGTGSATAAILPVLPDGRFDYMYTDISAGFFADAEARFGGSEASIDYRMLDIEKDPVAQGFDRHGYDLVIASNVLHATRYLDETLTHCLRLLAPSGQMVALENLRGMGWMDLTFGTLDGWWRFADAYRPNHALVNPSVWRRVLADAGFEEVGILGVDESDPSERPDKGVIVARGPAAVTEEPGVWVLASDSAGVGSQLAAALAARNQTVVLAGPTIHNNGHPGTGEAGIVHSRVDIDQRESWGSLLQSLPDNAPLSGIVHCVALDGHGPHASTQEVAHNTKQVVASALALTQGLLDSDLVPDNGVWFLTQGAQVLERELGGVLAGATLWGFAKAVSREAAHLQPRVIDLDPLARQLLELPDELLYPDPENHIAYRYGRRMVARLIRAGTDTDRLSLPEHANWVLAPDPNGIFDQPYVMPLPARPLEPREVRVAVAAAGLNFWDVFRSLGFIEEGNLGREMCGHVVEVGAEVSTVAVGDPVVGLGFGAFAAEMITREELVAPAPTDRSVTDLATVPSAFVSAALSYELSGLHAGDRVLVHAGAGGVGLAAIQLARLQGAEVYATASAPKQSYLRSIGVEHVFDSRTTSFGEEILEATNGAGVDVVLNSLTSEGFIDASLSCLAQCGRFVELARRDILTPEEMAAARPDVAYAILELDVLKKTEPALVGRVLRDIMAHIAAGDIQPLIHSRWPLAEAGAALRFMRSARHIGKIVVTRPPLKGRTLRPDRTYLVTGGLGGIGCAVASWLAEHGAGAIVLNGRRPPDPEVEEAIDALCRQGARVDVQLADVTDSAAVDCMLARIDRELLPLGGVIHSVGVLSDASLSNQSWERFETVLWPKVLGAWHLHRATVDRDLDLFVLFSSRVGVMGNPGQTNHAAANAFLDQLAAHRRALGLPGQAIAWGAWSEIGEAAEQRDRIERQRAALGGRWFTPAQGLKAFDRLVRQDVTHAVVMAMDWTVFEQATEDRPSFLEDLLITRQQPDIDSSSQSEDLMSRFRAAAEAERESMLVPFLQQEVQAVLRLPSAPTATVGFFDLGMDSLMAVELRNRLNRALAGEYVVSNTAVFDYPDIATFARHLAEELAQLDSGGDPVPATETAEPESRPSAVNHDDDIAIVGMACRFPGAPDLSSFWHLLESGGDAVTDGRQDPGDWSGVAGDPAAADCHVRQGAFLGGIDRFDAKFFRILPIEARMMDPRQRLLLETVWHALEDAGIDPERLRGSRTGAYIGVASGDYRDLAGAADPIGYLGSTPSVTAGRIAFAFGLGGPAVPVDVACASSLAAVHHAVSALQRNEVDLAIVGGVSAVLSPRLSTVMAELGLLSKSGRCGTFDASADGFVRGEGCGVVVLKRRSDAMQDGNRNWGTIRGSAVNQNGASAGLTVPNGPSQERVIQEALDRAGVIPSEVDYLEANGVGSELADPIEVLAAAAVYGRGRDPEQPLWMGSVKTNIGHQECAAGVAGLIKSVLAMRAGVVPRHLNFEVPSPHVDWDQLPVQIPVQSTPWPMRSDKPPIAGVSSFGISGTNVHVVVECGSAEDEIWRTGPDAATSNGSPEAVAHAMRTTVPVPESLARTWPELDEGAFRTTRILPLSGKSDATVRVLADRYVAWLDRLTERLCEGHAVAQILADAAFTAGTGRSHFDHRVGLVFSDVSSLRDQLLTQANGAPARIARKYAGLGTLLKTAFVYTSHERLLPDFVETLYSTEPVFRTVLNRCDAVFGDAGTDITLIDVILGGSDTDRKRLDASFMLPAVYALQCALTSLWDSVGVRPHVVAGHATGALAAAYAAGVFGLADGLRFAAGLGAIMATPKVRMATAMTGDAFANGRDRLDAIEEAMAGIAFAPPSLPVFSPAQGRILGADAELDAVYWRDQMDASESSGQTAAALAERDVQAVVEIGPSSIAGPSVLSDGSNDVPRSETSFAHAVAKAYESGMSISFDGLFAGEARRRIALPLYPFERKRYWFDQVC